MSWTVGAPTVVISRSHGIGSIGTVKCSIQQVFRIAGYHLKGHIYWSRRGGPRWPLLKPKPCQERRRCEQQLPRSCNSRRTNQRSAALNAAAMSAKETNFANARGDFFRILLASSLRNCGASVPHILVSLRPARLVSATLYANRSVLVPEAKAIVRLSSCRAAAKVITASAVKFTEKRFSAQLSAGRCTSSITNTLSAIRAGSSRSPNCACTAVNSDGREVSGSAAPFAASRAHCN
jgi:hypothetical protein